MKRQKLFVEIFYGGEIFERPGSGDVPFFPFLFLNMDFRVIPKIHTKSRKSKNEQSSLKDDLLVVPPFFIVFLLPHYRLTLLHDLTPLLKFVNLSFYCSFQSMTTIPWIDLHINYFDNFFVNIYWSYRLYCLFWYLSNVYGKFIVINSPQILTRNFFYNLTYIIFN